MLDRPITDVLCIVSECLKPILTEYLPVFYDNPPAELLSQSDCTLTGTSESVAFFRFLDQIHTLYNYMNRLTTSLKPRNSFIIEVQYLLSCNINASMQIHNAWKEKWTNSASHLHFFVIDLGSIPTGH